MKILITGFDPFGGESVNPSAEAIKALPDRINGTVLVKRILPTVFGKAGEVLRSAIEEHRPDAVICVGQAGGRNAVTPERVALNLRDASIPDNEGNQPTDEVLFPEGDTALLATLPIKKMVQRIKDAGLPASLSNTAGTFVCNEVMYTALYTAKTRYPEMKAGFIHIPYIREQIAGKAENTPFMEFSDTVAALTEAIKVMDE